MNINLHSIFILLHLCTKWAGQFWSDVNLTEFCFWCKGHLVDHDIPTSILCCDSGSLCNEDLRPYYRPTNVTDPSHPFYGGGTTPSDYQLLQILLGAVFSLLALTFCIGMTSVIPVVYYIALIEFLIVFSSPVHCLQVPSKRTIWEEIEGGRRE